MSVDELESEARKLSKQDQLLLSERLAGRGLELTDEEKGELDRRVDAWREGRAETIPAAKVFAEVRQRLRITSKKFR